MGSESLVGWIDRGDVDSSRDLVPHSVGTSYRKEGNLMIIENIEVQPVREGVYSFDATANTSLPARWSGLVGDASWAEMWNVVLELQGVGPFSLSST